MKKILNFALVFTMGSSALYAGGFEKRFEMMNSRIHTKMEKYKSNAAAQEFLNKKLSCVKAAKSEADLKACKKKFHPKDLKKLL